MGFRLDGGSNFPLLPPKNYDGVYEEEEMDGPKYCKVNEPADTMLISRGALPSGDRSWKIE